jgi:hypothetical protein
VVRESNPDAKFLQEILGVSTIARVLYFLSGISLLVAAYCCYTWRAWGLYIAMLIVALIPIHPGDLIGLPSGIWGMTQICRSSVHRSFTAK